MIILAAITFAVTMFLAVLLPPFLSQCPTKSDYAAWFVIFGGMALLAAKSAYETTAVIIAGVVL